MRAGRSSTLPIVVSTEPAEPPKVRWRLDIAYDGTNFSGWAAQAGLRTVQGELETWIARVLRLDEQPRLVCAGRTDAGVHARGQVAHLDLDATVITDGGDALTRRLNKVLGGDCVVRRISAAPPGFDARFGADLETLHLSNERWKRAAGPAVPQSDRSGEHRTRSCSAE